MACFVVRSQALLGRNSPGLIGCSAWTLQRRATQSSGAGALVNGHPANNVSPTVAAKVGRKLHNTPAHPLNIIKNRIVQYFNGSNALLGRPDFRLFNDLPPVVTVEDNFDSLLIPEGHVSRQPSDTYYVDNKHVLRCHTSAHQTRLMRQGHDAFLVCGDVYRRDEIDRSHHPVFHQMEGVRIFNGDEIPHDLDPASKAVTAEKDLKAGLEGLALDLFGDVQMRWVDAYFPFTHPSAELEIYFQGDWLEVLGCGVIHQGVMANGGRDDGSVGWAFGLGLERLAMVLFSIPDIRLFWSQDARFTSQFQEGNITAFQPYSKYPPCSRDLSFWLPKAETGQGQGSEDKTFHQNNLFELVRDIAGDLVEQIHLVDQFTHPKSLRESQCFRITYRSMDRSLTNQEVDALQILVRREAASRLGVEVR